MYVFLVRHAIAHERDPKRWPQDSKRPLTPAGKRRFRKAARGLALSLPKSAAILTSPYVRTRQTAKLLASVARLGAPVDCAALAADEPVSKVFKVLAKRTDRELVLVGHEPGMGRLLAAALAGHGPKLSVEFKKGGAACVEFSGRVRPGRGTLLWYLPPRMLRAMR